MGVGLVIATVLLYGGFFLFGIRSGVGTLAAAIIFAWDAYKDAEEISSGA